MPSLLRGEQAVQGLYSFRGLSVQVLCGDPDKPREIRQLGFGYGVAGIEVSSDDELQSRGSPLVEVLPPEPDGRIWFQVQGRSFKEGGGDPHFGV